MVKESVSPVLKSGKPSLNLTVAGVPFRSPIGVAALGNHFGKELYYNPKLYAEITADIALRHVKAGAGYIYVTGAVVSEQTIRKLRERSKVVEKHQPPPGGMRARLIRAGRPVAPEGTEGLYTIASPFWIDAERARMSDRALEMVMKILKGQSPEDVPIIANTIGFGDLPDTWVDGARRWEELGADMIELNLSCCFPSAMRGAVDDFFQRRFPSHFQGLLVGDHPDIAEEIVRQVVEAVSLPVGVKISPETGFPRVVGLTKRLRDAGASFVQVFNSAVGIAPPDIYHGGKPLWPFMEGNPFCMSSGSWLRFPCYRDVAAIARFVPGIEIAAAGGLMQPEHCVEVMMLGASLAELCTGVIEQGRDLIRRSNEFMQNFMEEQGYQSLQEFIGLGQQYIRYNEDVTIEDRVIIELDEEKCTRCGRCLNTMCIAMYSERGKILVDADRCSGCGACIVACPDGALQLVRQD